MHRHRAFLACLIPALLAVPQTAVAQRADPAGMQRSPEVRRPAPVDPRVAGAWDVWISGAVTYSSDGRSVYQNYEPGAAMNRLEIAPDGRYRWGNHSGRLVEVLPWHHQPDRRYYRVVHQSGMEYDFYADGDRLIILFGGVGGHASTGTRLTGGVSQPATAAQFSAGEAVEVEWSGRWHPATVLKPENGRYRISYSGYDSSWDEWVPPSRVRKTGAARPQPSPTSALRPAPLPVTTDNPLGVEWRSGSTAPSAPQPPAGPRPQTPAPNNPLGVEWAGGGSPARPAPIPPSPAAPPPTPRNPPQPPPQGGGSHPASLVDRWLYQAVAFVDGSGTVSESRGVSGSLVFRSDGRYQQALTIGGILNAVNGTYQVNGTQVVTNYQWSGKAASDQWVIQLDAGGDKLTMVRHGSPTVYHTLRRAD